MRQACRDELVVFFHIYFALLLCIEHCFAKESNIILLMQFQASDGTHRFIATALFRMAMNDHTHQATLASDR